jgi:guanylate cyclase
VEAEAAAAPTAAGRLAAIASGLFARVAVIGADPRDDEELRLRKALLVLIAVMILPVSLVWGGLYLALGSPVGYVPFLYFAVSLMSILVFARTRDVDVFLRVQLADILLAPTLSMAPLGGFLGAGGVGLWGILAPLGALVFGGVRDGVRWFAAFVVVFLASGLVGEAWRGLPLTPAWFNTTMLALNVVVASVIVFTLLAIFAQQRGEALAALRTEQDKAENLLLNILPKSIAEKLKAESQTIADQFDAASILFADVVDFTPLSERLPAAEVVGILDHLFSHFDELADRHGLEKIKTIGDCYMVAAGVPAPRPDHARAMAQMALEMTEAMRSEDGVGHLGLELRIGINSGPVVAGVIGRKRFLYDLWGDAVNTASRMESSGTPGRIQVTRATYELLEDEFRFEPRGRVEVKGKGEMETWYLVGPKTA